MKQKIKKALKIEGIAEEPAKPVEQVQHDMSFACITYHADAHYLPDMIASLPLGVELVIVNTIQCKDGEEEKIVLRFDKEKDSRHLRIADYHFKKWRFDKARNVSIDLCQREWVMWIDSDDRLVPAFNDELVRCATELSPFVGGITLGCYGFQPPYEEGKRGAYYATPHLRIFRRSTGAKFRGIVHEQIDQQITNGGFTIVESGIPVIHIGYETDAQTLIGKMQRNVDLLCQQRATDPTYLPDYYESCLKNNLFTLLEMKGLQNGR